MAYDERSAATFQAPVFLGSLFSGDESDDDDVAATAGDAGSKSNNCSAAAAASSGSAASNGMLSAAERAQGLDCVAGSGRSLDVATGLRFEETVQEFGCLRLRLRQFDDHVRNANICWPEARLLAEWLLGNHLIATGSNTTSTPLTEEQRKRRFDQLLIGFDTGRPFPTPVSAEGKKAELPLACAPLPFTAAELCCPSCSLARRPLHVLELGAATGALVVFLRSLGVQAHSSDIADELVSANIAHNMLANGLSIGTHLPHSWGERMEELDEYIATHGAPDVLLASDVLAYENSFEALADTIARLMPERGADAPVAVASPMHQQTEGAASSCACASAAVLTAGSDAPLVQPACVEGSASITIAAAVECRCTPRPSSVMHMMWKRSHDRSLLDGFWRLLHARGFTISTRGNKVYEIRRGKHVPSTTGALVHYIK
jgi:hypothetical protein